LIKHGVFTFDLNEDLLITLDYKGNLQYLRGIYQDSKCTIHKDKILNIQYTVPENTKLKKISMNSFNCLWAVNNKNQILFATKLNFYPEYKQESNDDVVTFLPLDSSSNVNGKVKFIETSENKLYVGTRENSIYIKEDIFNINYHRCEIGKTFQMNKDFSFNMSLFKKIKDYGNNIIALDNNGKLYYRRFVNEINENGDSWAELKLLKEPELERIVDFDIGPYDMYTINSNGKIRLIANINKPRIFDV
jgi:hypothetical protein